VNGEAAGAVLAPPELTLDERDALTAFWTIYERHFDEVAADVERDLREHPEVVSFVGSANIAESNAHRAAITAALVDGRWDAYLADMSATGARYAEAGLSFPVWFEAGRAVRSRLMPLLVEALADEPEQLAAAVRGMAIFVDLAMVAVGDAYVQTKQRIILEQQRAILELSTPVLELRPGLLILPVIGLIDTERARMLTEQLLQGIAAYRGKVVVLDVTGVPAVDSAVANHLLQSVQAARLMGATALLSGLSADNAQTLSRLGLDLAGVTTVGTLADAVEIAGRFLAEPPRLA
jgi:rsbT co-antagonist protein RsbR